MPELLNTIRSSLVLWKTTDSTIKTKTNILKAFALSKLTYYSYVENFKEEELNQINKLVEWFLSAPNNKNASGFQVINLMRTKRARYPLKVGGWNIWNIELRQLAQKLWIINQFILALETKQTNSSHHKSWEYQIQKNKFTSRYLKENLDEWNKIRIKKAIFNNNLTSIKNENGQPLSLAEWYTTIQDQNPTIPKTEFQSSLNLIHYPLTNESLSYSSLLKKWHKLATLEYIKKAKDLKNLSAKDHNNFKDPKILLTSTIKLRKTTANYYCIPESSLPNIISFDQFI
ncbi:hypothetical protein ACTFIT_005812 [Dictyostelium discoideum]